MDSLCKLYEIQGEDLDNLSTKLDQSPYVECLILDRAELIADIDKEAHKLLCSLLSAHKRKFSVLISCNSSRFLLEHPSLEYVKDHTSVQIEFTPQNKEQIILTISQFIKMFNLEITSEQKHILAQKSQGSPLFVKQVLTGVRAGISFEEAIIKFLDPENPFKEDLDTIKGGTTTGFTIQKILY